jgi:DNA-binding winged helix-turn-helix (wHTH) protein
VELTTAQFDILAFLMRRPGRVYSRIEILEGAGGLQYEGYERTLDVHVKNIRKALGDDGARPRYIGTVRGVGYKMIEPGPRPSGAGSSSSSRSSPYREGSRPTSSSAGLRSRSSGPSRSRGTPRRRESTP